MDILDDLTRSITQTAINGLKMADNYYLVVMLPVALFFGIFKFFPLTAKGFETGFEQSMAALRKILLTVLLACFAALVVLLGIMSIGVEKGGTELINLWGQGIAKRSLWLIPTWILGYWLRFTYLRTIAPKLSELRRKVTSKQDKDKLSGVDEEEGKYVTKKYIPSKYYKKGKVFLGLTEDDKPFYMDEDTFYKKHKQVVGPTGFGKGVIYGMLIDQKIRLSSGPVFYIDPKEDEFIPRIMEQAARETGREFVYLSFVSDEVGRWGPFLGGSKTDARARFERAFRLQKTGSDADIYKVRERRTGHRAFQTGRDVETLFRYAHQEDPDSGIAVELELWAENKSFCCTEGNGFLIEDAILGDKIVYIKTDLDDAVMLNATSLVMFAIAQECKRLKNERKTRVSGYFDEVSFYVTAEIAERLASIRNSNLDFSLAYQSFLDMKNLKDRNINANYVFASVNTNCQIKFFYGGGDSEQAEKISKDSGTVFKEIESSLATEINEAAAEIWKNQTIVSQKEEALIPINRVLMLPEQVCIFKEVGKNAKILHTSFVPVKDMEALNRHIDNLKREELKAESEKSETTSPSESTVMLDNPLK